jgi:sulfur carrier protein
MDTAETKTIQVVVNGDPRSLPAGLNVDRMLQHLKIDAARVAVELNGAIIRKAEWPSAEVREGARLEIVWFVGGGAH